jgi:hypothetical protein
MIPSSGDTQYSESTNSKGVQNANLRDSFGGRSRCACGFVRRRRGDDGIWRFRIGFGNDERIGAMVTPTYLVVIIGLGLLLALWLSRPRTLPVAAKSSSTSALHISKTRYAKGEITKEQYDAIQRDLGK